MPKITEKYGKNAFEFRENAIVVKIAFNWINVMGDKLGNKTGNKMVSAEAKDVHLNATQLQVLNYIRDNNITKKQLQEKNQKSKTTIDNTIRFLRENGLLERIGSNKTLGTSMHRICRRVNMMRRTCTRCCRRRESIRYYW